MSLKFKGKRIKKPVRYDRYEPQQEFIGSQELTPYSPILVIDPIPSNSIKRIQTQSASNAQNTIYTVPSGTKFWLISCMMSYTTSAATTTVSRLQVNGTDDILRAAAGGAANEHDNVSISFPTPIVLTAGETLTIQNGSANATTLATIQGYEITLES